MTLARTHTPAFPALRAPSFRLRKSAQAELSHDGTRLAQLTQRLVVWDVATRKVAYDGKLIANEHHVAVSPDGSTVAVKNREGALVFLDLASQSEISRTPVSGAAEGGCKPVFSADGRHLLDARHDGTIRVWEVATAKEVARSDAYVFSYGIPDIAVARGCDDYFVALSRNGGIPDSRVLRIPGMNLDRAEALPITEGVHATARGWLPIMKIAVDDAGARLVMALSCRQIGRSNAVVIQDLATGTTVATELASALHDVRSMICTNEGLVAAVVHDFQSTQGLSWNDERRKSLELTHLHFLDACSGQALARWHWPDAWSLGHSPVTGALAVGSIDTPGACMIDAPFTPANREWLAADPRHRP